MTAPRAVVSWSSGKDCAFALNEVLKAGTYDVAGLLTSTNSDADRVSMHGTRNALLEAQARAAGLPLITVGLPWPCTNEIYEARMQTACDALIADGITHVIFGDLFLQDVRDYREKQLEGTGLTPVFPIWGRPTDRLAREMIATGFETRLVSVDPNQLDPSFAGRKFDAALLDELPDGVDPCGENGEFHTAVTNTPFFDAPIPHKLGEIVTRSGFIYADIIPL